MANQEHLNIARKGVKVWLKWREEHPDILPDLSEAHLIDDRLPRINFRRTNFEKADLSGMNLEGAVSARLTSSPHNLGRLPLMRNMVSSLILGVVGERGNLLRTFAWYLLIVGTGANSTFVCRKPYGKIYMRD